MTDLKYLEDSYVFEYNGTITDLGEDSFGEYIVLDSTIFYPQGGGQPSDTGTISNGENTFKVQKCMLDPNGVVLHYGETSQGNFNIGEIVGEEIDKEKRLLNTRNHSAGHLIDVAIQELGYNKILTATKGYHFPQGPYVEFQGDFSDDKEVFTRVLESTLSLLIEKNIPISARIGNTGDTQAPEGKSLRIVTFEGYKGVGCGGTHIRSTKEIGEMSIRKVKYKKGILKISYVVKNNPKITGNT